MTIRARVGELICSLPDRMPVWLGCLGLAGVLCAHLGAVHPALVLPLAAVFIVVTWRAIPAAPRTDATALGALAVLALFVVVWTGFGLRGTGEYVVVNRDPGFLTLRALWWTHHWEPTIGVGGAEQAAVSGASAGTEAFALSGGALHPQGNTMLPALLAAAGWVGGDRGVLAGSVLIGAVALVAMYALARRMVGPVLALAPMAVLGCCLPFLVFTRSAYTEPLTVMLLCGGLALIAAGGGGALRWWTAGAMLGGVGAARIDGGVVVVGLALAAGLMAWAPLSRTARRVWRGRAGAVLGGAVAMDLLGLLDVWRLSHAYAEEHRTQIVELLMVTVLAVVLAGVALTASRWGNGALRRFVWYRRRALGVVLAVVIVVGGCVLVSRPLWYVGRHIDADGEYGTAVEILQWTAGLPLDGSRSYDELTLTWTSWYIGWAAIVLGGVGCALLAWRAVAGRSVRAALVLPVLAVAGVFPVVLVNITPDQIWATRRLLPATYPMLLMGATVAVDAVGRLIDRWFVLRRAVTWLAVCALLVPAVLGWRGVADTRELSGRLSQARAVCAALEQAGADRVIWVHSSPFRYLATLRVICDVEVVEFVTVPSTSDLAAVRAAWGSQTVAAASFDASDLPWVAQPTVPVGRTESTTLGRELNEPPTKVDTTVSEVWVGTVGVDGLVTALP